MSRLKPILVITMVLLFGQLNGQILYDHGPIIDKKNGDLSSAWSTDGRNWDCAVVTYMFINGTNDISLDEEEDAVRAAFLLWQNQTSLLFTEVFNEADADIRIMWGTFNHGDPCTTGCSFDGQHGVLAHAYFPPPTFNEFAGDIHFDDSENWTLNSRGSSAQPIDLVTVAAHEIGHSLGLEHSTVTSALMYGTYNGSHRYLSQDDIDGIRSIYGNPMTISNNDLVCSSQNVSFTINNLNTDIANVTWSVSPANMFVTSGGAATSGAGINATVRAASGVSGWATLTYTLTDNCGGTGILEREFWVGVPPRPGTINIAMDAPPRRFTATINELSQATSYKWYLNSSYNQTTSAGAAIFNRSFPYCGNTYMVEVEALNACGTSLKKYTYAYEPSCGGSMYKTAIVYPNPSNDETKIQIIDEENDINNFTWSLEVYDDKQKLIYDKKDIKTYDYSINTRKLKKGIYHIRIYYNDEVINEKLLVTR